MSTKFKFLFMLIVAIGIALPGTSLGQKGEIETKAVDGDPSTPITAAGIVPMFFAGNNPGNISSCAYLGSLLGFDPTPTMVGIKVDPPVNYNDGSLSVTISGDGTTLSWSTTNATLLGFIVKGGPNYNVYDYVLSGLTSDSGLGSPPFPGPNQFPEISHYNFCYEPKGAGGQGCTPGYWRNHADRWVGVTPLQDFDTVFGVDLFDPNITLGQAIVAIGGGNNAFARQATAALLSAYAGELGSNSQFVNYPFSSAQVIQMVQDAVNNGTIEQTKDTFEAANELGCPLSGTAACSPRNPAACLPK